MTATDIKREVQAKYAGIATSTNGCGCCGAGSGFSADYEVFAEDYSSMEGYNPEADLQLGCGLPTKYAEIDLGDTVVDLGSGAGNDCFVARALVGESGKVIGVDFTPEMVDKARRNAAKLGFSNVEFREGDIENLPIAADTADVVVSNCVLNLVPDKKRAFAESFRILKPGGHLSISDVVVQGALPPSLQDDAEAYAGCVAGAIDKAAYLETMQKAGFSNIRVQKETRIVLPEAMLQRCMSSSEIESYNRSGSGVLSISVYAEKPLVKNCCTSDCCH